MEIPSPLKEGLMHAGIIILVLLLTFLLERSMRMYTKHHLRASSKHMNIQHRQFRVLRHFISALIYIIGLGTAIYLIPPLKTLSISLFASAGILAIVIGFASQKAFANIISGVFIVLFKPFRVGEIIKFQDKFGEVEDITLRHTIIRNFENKRIIVPNAIMSDEIVENYHIDDEKICKFVEFTISFESDVDKAIKIMKQEAKKHPDFYDVRTEEEKENKKEAIMVKVIRIDDNGVVLRAWVWAKDPKSSFALGWDLKKNIKKRFDKEDIEIPYPHRTIIEKRRKRK